MTLQKTRFGGFFVFVEAAVRRDVFRRTSQDNVEYTQAAQH
jgi:hypothetical protein